MMHTSKNVLPFPKPTEESSTDEKSKDKEQNIMNTRQNAREPKFEIGDIVSHCVTRDGTVTKETSQVLFINHDNILGTDGIYYGIFGYIPHGSGGIVIINEDNLTLVEKRHKCTCCREETNNNHTVDTNEPLEFVILENSSVLTVLAISRLLNGVTPTISSRLMMTNILFV